MSVYEKLLKIQGCLKAPKGQYNNFGKYKYRSCEDILEALKPLLVENKAVVTINDSLVQIGERYYVQAIATLVDVEDGEKVSVMAYARESASKKGMDESQVTGATSSYARKYALNGLFAIDDNKDMDYMQGQFTGENRGDNKQKKQSRPKQDNEQEVKHMFNLASEAGIKPAKIAEKMMIDFKKSKTADLTSDEIKQLVDWISQISFEDIN